MLIVSYLIFTRVVMPTMASYARALFGPVMTVVIIFIGMVIIFGALGMHISHNLGGTIVNGVFRGIGACGRAIWQALRWFVRSTGRLLRRVFNGTLSGMRAAGVNRVVSNIVACIACVIVLAIII